MPSAGHFRLTKINLTNQVGVAPINRAARRHWGLGRNSGISAHFSRSKAIYVPCRKFPSALTVPGDSDPGRHSLIALDPSHLDYLPDLLTSSIEMLGFVITSGVANVQAPGSTEPHH